MNLALQTIPPCTYRGWPMSASDKQRFWKYVDRRGDDECWGWKAFRNKPGYGAIYMGGRPIVAHRISYMIHHDAPIPDGVEVCHACDNPECTNPKHLWLGTHHDNMVDAVLKGRMNKPKERCARGHLMTEENTALNKARGHFACRTCKNTNARNLRRNASAALTFGEKL